jgi:phenylalanyl-tRNA synthetase alpha chain
VSPEEGPDPSELPWIEPAHKEQVRTWQWINPSHVLSHWNELKSAIEAADADVARFATFAAGVTASANNVDDLGLRRTVFLGRDQGEIRLALKRLADLSIEERKSKGKSLNLAKQAIEEVETARRRALERAAEARAGQGLDVTIPGRRPWAARAHVLAQVQEEMLDLFHGLGYSVYQSPEVESESYNFTRLNFPPDHPARDMHDTYWIDPGSVLRTHTSPGWVRDGGAAPPLSAGLPWPRLPRRQVDASHMDQFHQMDGLFVGRGRQHGGSQGHAGDVRPGFYGPRVKTRLVPIYFPSSSRVVGADIACAICEGTGKARSGEGRCPVCGGSGWSELLGAGMVHPNVFRAVGYDPEEVTGFAFGMGLERIAMARFGIPEIRLFLENDLRFLNQF